MKKIFSAVLAIFVIAMIPMSAMAASLPSDFSVVVREGVSKTFSETKLMEQVEQERAYLQQKAAPTSKGLSYVAYQYWHKSCGSLSGGHISAYGAYVTKHIIDWYPKINRAGTPQTSVEFEIQKIY